MLQREESLKKYNAELVYALTAYQQVSLPSPTNCHELTREMATDTSPWPASSHL